MILVDLDPYETVNRDSVWYRFRYHIRPTIDLTRYGFTMRDTSTLRLERQRKEMLDKGYYVTDIYRENAC